MLFDPVKGVICSILSLALIYNYGQSLFNSLGPSDAIWRQRSGSTLARVMACCLTAPRHYLNQCWLIISKVEWHSPKGEFTRDTSAINRYNHLENFNLVSIGRTFPFKHLNVDRLCHHCFHNRHRGQYKVADILQTTLSNEFSSKNMFVFWCTFH